MSISGFADVGVDDSNETSCFLAAIACGGGDLAVQQLTSKDTDCRHRKWL